MLHSTLLSNALEFSPLNPPPHFYSFLSHMYILCHPPLPPFHSSMHSPILFPLNYLHLAYALFPSHFSYTLPFFLPLSPLEWTLSIFTHSNNLHLSYILSISLYKPFSPTYFSFASQIPLQYCGYIYFLFLYILPSVFKISSHFPVKHYSAYHKQSLLIFPNSSYFP